MKASRTPCRWLGCASRSRRENYFVVLSADDDGKSTGAARAPSSQLRHTFFARLEEVRSPAELRPRRIVGQTAFVGKATAVIAGCAGRAQRRICTSCAPNADPPASPPGYVLNPPTSGSSTLLRRRESTSGEASSSVTLRRSLKTHPRQTRHAQQRQAHVAFLDNG